MGSKTGRGPSFKMCPTNRYSTGGGERVMDVACRGLCAHSGPVAPAGAGWGGGGGGASGLNALGADAGVRSGDAFEKLLGTLGVRALNFGHTAVGLLGDSSCICCWAFKVCRNVEFGPRPPPLY